MLLSQNKVSESEKYGDMQSFDKEEEVICCKSLSLLVAFIKKKNSINT